MSVRPFPTVDTQLGDILFGSAADAAKEIGVSDASSAEFGRFAVGWLSMSDPDELQRCMAGYRRLLDARRDAA